MKKLLLLVFSLLSAAKCESCGAISREDVEVIFIKDLDYNFKAVSLKDAYELLQDPAFNQSRSTVIYSYDFLENSDSQSVNTISYPFLKRGDFNVAVLDTGKFFGGNYYFTAVPNAVKIGKLVGETLVEMNEKHGYDLDSVLLVGFSLGAHLMGEVGRTVRAASNSALSISKIVGLDPSGPGFYPLNPYLVALNKNDADYVQVIHTDTSNFGMPVPVGHADFWPNSGTRQPSCPLFDEANILREENQCSHMRSVDYYAESVFKKKAPDFHAISCDSWEDFQNHNCFGSRLTPVNNMGFNANAQLSGNFYLRTNGHPKYSRDSNGIFFIDNIFASHWGKAKKTAFVRFHF